VKPIARVADGTDDSRRQIGASADVVDDLVGLRIEEHPVDGEVAAAGILFRRRGPNAHRMSAIPILRVGTKAGDLDRMAIIKYQHHAELCSDWDGTVEDALHRGDVCIRGDIEIERFFAAQPVADAAAREIRAEAVLA
jgi:hypothetical protein